MPMKLNVGICKKLGLPDYGSIAANCNVELELDQSLMAADPDGFGEKVRQVYGACRREVEEELNRHRQAVKTANRQPAQPAPTSRQVAGNGAGQHGSGTNGSGTNGNGGRPATEKQFTYIRQLSGQIKGLGVRRLETLANSMFGKPMAELTSLDASGLIDTLKAIKSGEIDFDNTLSGATT